jgi:hypothetical protein
VESKRGRIRRVGTIHRVKAVVLIAAGLALQSFGQEEEETKSISPDEKWEFRLIETDSTSKDDAGAQKLVIAKTGSTDIALELPEDAINSFTSSANVVWAPNSKRFAFNYQAGSRYITTELYQLRRDKWIRLHSPEDAASTYLEKEKRRRLREAKMAKDTYQRRIWDTFRVREWPDANTASLYAYSIRSVPISKEGEETSDIEAYFLFTLKFDDTGEWKIVKAHALSAEENEKIDRMDGE